MDDGSGNEGKRRAQPGVVEMPMPVPVPVPIASAIAWAGAGAGARLNLRVNPGYPGRDWVTSGRQPQATRYKYVSR